MWLFSVGQSYVKPSSRRNCSTLFVHATSMQLRTTVFFVRSPSDCPTYLKCLKLHTFLKHIISLNCSLQNRLLSCRLRDWPRISRRVDGSANTKSYRLNALRSLPFFLNRDIAHTAINFQFWMCNTYLKPTPFRGQKIWPKQYQRMNHTAHSIFTNGNIKLKRLHTYKKNSI